MAANIQQTTLRIDQRQIDQEKEELLKWITKIDYTTYQSYLIKRRQERTGKWFSESPEFQNWMNGRGTTLFCPGIPGAGKTMITAIVIDHLERLVCPTSPMNAIASLPPVGIAYIYCRFKRRDKQQREDLLACLLRQLVQQRASIPDKLISVLENYRRMRKRLSIDDLQSRLDTIAVEFSKIFIMVDALDECQISHDVQRDLLFSLQSKHNLNFFATSRHIPEIISNFDGCSRLEVRATQEDIEEYLRGHMPQLPAFVSRDPQLQSEIVSKITQSADGMFLLAQLHHGSLKGKATKKAVNSMLEKLPTGTEAYSHAYLDAMTRITSQLRGLRDLALNVLSWICCAMELLTVPELPHALAIEIGQSYLDEENIPDVDIMISVCAGLVTFDEESNIIRLVHYTMHQYFEETWDSWFPNAHRSLALTCITYLSFTVFNARTCSDHENFDEMLVRYPLYSYSAWNWGHHAFEAEKAEYDELNEDITAYTQFLKNDGNFSTAMEVIKWENPIWQEDYHQMFGESFTLVHVAAYFGLAKSARRLILDGLAADSQDMDECTPHYSLL